MKIKATQVRRRAAQILSDGGCSSVACRPLSDLCCRIVWKVFTLLSQTWFSDKKISPKIEQPRIGMVSWDVAWPECSASPPT